MYTGIFFEEKELKEIQKRIAHFVRAHSAFVDQHNRWKEVEDLHVTLWMGSCDKDLLNKRGTIIVDGVGKNEKALALRVEKRWLGEMTHNKTPHITLMYNTAAGGKPVDSNNITEWKEMEPFELEGVIKEHE